MRPALFVISLLVASIASHGAEFNPDEYLGEYWYGLYLTGSKAGHSVTSLQKEGENYLSTEDAQFRITMAGLKQEMHIVSKRVYDAGGTLVSIDSTVVDPAGTTEFHATVQGEELHLTTKIAGKEEQTVLPRPKESLKDAVKHAHWVRQKPNIGDTMSFTMFEPMAKEEIDGTSTILGVEERVFQGVKTQVYRIGTELPRLGLNSESYVAESGVTLEDVVSGIIRMRLEEENLAKNTDYSNDVIISNAVRLEDKIEDPRTRERLALILKGPLEKEHLFVDGRQRIVPKGDGSFLFVANLQKADEDEPLTFPITDEELQKWVQPTTFVQSDDPGIAAKAKEIVGNETHVWPAVEKLCHWVSENVGNAFSARLTNASEVFDSLKGDCTEHSVLFIALCRALGIPAREVSGLVYIDDGPGFYYHQWAKVWVGKWVDVDPTFDQPIADVTHIKLAEGDLFEQAKIMPIIGNLKITPAPDDALASLNTTPNRGPQPEPQPDPPGPDPEPLPMPEPTPAPEPGPVPDPEPEPVPNVPTP